ncbi:phenoloxidase-activating factor 2-like [Scylla paramamosain]|uniref:phenoloxidase-activating factor 2-like n=1 Tax=Scylla paramamosain TaxID=85552 RepID=UPI00308351FD
MRQLAVLVAVVALVAAVPRERRQTKEYAPCKDGAGVCVPYYLCKDGQIVMDGTGIIDIRIGDPTKKNSQDCISYLDVCCGQGSIIESTTTTTTTTTTTEAPAVTTPAPFQAFCGKRNPEGIDVRIQGFKNNQAQYAEFPWMAAVLHKKFGDKPVNLYVCGGSLIHPSIVLTAAHCVARYGHSTELYVRLGEWDTQKEYEPYPHQDIAVDVVVIHPDFHPGNLANDFALLHLAKPAKIAKNVGIICLEKINYLTTNYTCVVAGWGKDKFGKEGVYQNVLKTVNLPYVNRGDCQNSLRYTRLGKYFKLHESFLCAGGEEGKDSCSGDGGSPLMCQNSDSGSYVQAGIVAWGIGCGTGGVPGVYADVSYAFEWITTEADKLAEGNGAGDGASGGDGGGADGGAGDGGDGGAGDGGDGGAGDGGAGDGGAGDGGAGDGGSGGAGGGNGGGNGNGGGSTHGYGR